MAAIAFKEGAGLYRKGFVQDIAFHMAGRRQGDPAGADTADHLAANGDILGIDFAMDFRFVADDQAGAAQIAFYLSVNLYVAALVEGTVDHHVGADDGGRGMRTVALGARGRQERGRHLIGGGFFTSAREHGGQPL
jgi:uncharacterized membrane protein YtjA (UPF0391 family)